MDEEAHIEAGGEAEETNRFIRTRVRRCNERTGRVWASDTDLV